MIARFLSWSFGTVDTWITWALTNGSAHVTDATNAAVTGLERTREVLNERVKYREAMRPLAPMLTLEAARLWFELSDGASDDDYNAYNYMVLTARAKPSARERIPAVIHRDGTGRLQIVRQHTDPLGYAYLKALGRRIGVEVAVNTSFNVAGPIAQTVTHAIETLRRSKGMDAIIMIAEEGTAYAVWHRDAAQRNSRCARPEAPRPGPARSRQGKHHPSLRSADAGAGRRSAPPR